MKNIEQLKARDNLTTAIDFLCVYGADKLEGLDDELLHDLRLLHRDHFTG